MIECCTLYVTCPTRQAAVDIGRRLVTEKLIACANITAEMTSLYRWQGTVCEDPEVAIFIKTPRRKAAAAITRITELHPYDTPCIVQWDITAGHEDYLKWVEEVCSDEA